METKVKIDRQESAEVERLFMEFNGYCSILGYLSNYGAVDTDRFDKKWAEAVEIETKLEKLKANLDKKYHPDDGKDYHSFNFDFDNCEMIYT